MSGMKSKLIFTFCSLLVIFPFFRANAQDASGLYSDGVRENVPVTILEKLPMEESDLIFYIDFLAGSMDENVILGNDEQVKPNKAGVDRMLKLLKAQPNQLQASSHLLLYAQRDGELGKYIFSELEKIVSEDVRQTFVAVLLAENAMEERNFKKALAFFKRASEVLFLMDDAVIGQVYRGSESDMAILESVLSGGYICSVVCKDDVFKGQIEDFLKQRGKVLPLRAFCAFLRGMGRFVRVSNAKQAKDKSSPEGQDVLACMPAIAEYYMLALERATAAEIKEMEDDVFNDIMLCKMFSRLPYYLQILMAKYPGEERVYTILANVYETQRDYEAAYRTLVKYFSFFSRRANIQDYIAFSRLCFLADHPTEGIAAAQHAFGMATLAGKEAMASNIAKLACFGAIECGLEEEALPFAEKFRADDLRSLFAQVVIYLSLDKKDRMIQSIRESADVVLKAFRGQKGLRKTDWTTFMMLYGVAGMSHDVELVEKFFQVGLLKNPKESELYNGLAYFYACENVKLDLAEKYAGQALALSPNSAAITDTMAWIYFRSGRFELAEREMQKCFELLKQAKRTASCVEYYHMAEISFALKKYATAKDYWQKALDAYDTDEFSVEEVQGKLRQVESLLGK